MPGRPNIVLLMTDQQKFTASRAGGATQLHALGEDRLAGEGVTFTKHFVQNPTCLPSRACMLTGTYPQDNRVFNMTDTYGKAGPLAQVLQIQELLQPAGYRTGAVGHFHRNRGFDRGWDFTRDFGEPPIGLAFRKMNEYAVASAPKTEYGAVAWWCGTSPVPAEQSCGALTTDAAIEFLDTADDEPFFLHVAHLEPHAPYCPPRPYDTMYSPTDMTLPPPPDWQRATPWLKQMAKEAGMDLCTEDQVCRVIAAYYGLITYVDNEVVRLVDHLERIGKLDNTWILYTSDHGDFTGEHGMMTKAETCYDCNLRVPLIIRGPSGELPAGSRSNALVESVDLAPTICNIAGLDIPGQMRGSSLLPLARRQQRQPLRDAVFAAVGGNVGPSPHNVPQGIVASSRLKAIATMVRTDSAKLIRNPDHGHELYLLDADPGELVNRIDDPVAAGIRQQLCKRLDAWLDKHPISTPPII